jgi:hypothetical protein
MKKHVTSGHGDAWARWKNVNLNLVTKNDQCQEKSKHRSVVGYGPSQIILTVLLLIKRIWGKRNSWKTCSCLLPNVICLILLLRISGS